MATQPPSPKQLNYLKALAARTGQTFAWPKTSRQASTEIARLSRRTRQPQPSGRSSRSMTGWREKRLRTPSRSTDSKSLGMDQVRLGGSGHDNPESD